MSRIKKIIFKYSRIYFALVFILFAAVWWYHDILFFLKDSKEMFSNIRAREEIKKDIEEKERELEEIIESSPKPVVDNSISSDERLEYFKFNMPVVAEYYFGDIRVYEKSIFIQDKEVFGSVLSVDWDKQEATVLVPDIMNIREPSEEKTVSLNCPLSKTFVYYGENVVYEDSFLLEDGSLDLKQIIKPGVIVALSSEDSIYHDKLNWCIIY